MGHAGSQANRPHPGKSHQTADVSHAVHTDRSWAGTYPARACRPVPERPARPVKL